jgi:uncharacterized protein DUF5666
MTAIPRRQATPTTGRALPEPCRGARWRWSTPRKTLVASGALATVLSLVTGAAVVDAATSPASPGSETGPRGQPRAGAVRPTVLGRITALSGEDITVQTRGKKTTTVVSSSATTFKTLSGPSGTSSSSSASALRVGDFIGVQGTKDSDGTLTASSIVISTGPPTAGSGAARADAPRGGPSAGSPSS